MTGRTHKARGIIASPGTTALQWENDGRTHKAWQYGGKMAREKSLGREAAEKLPKGTGRIKRIKLRILTKKTEVAQWIRKKNVYKKNTMTM